jgi:putative transcriptional regulator
LTGEQHTDHIENGQRVSRHSLPTLRKTKRAIFCQRTDRQNDNNSNSFYIEKRDSQNIKTILADTFQNDMNRIKEVLEEKGIKQTWLAEQLGKSYNMVNGYVQNRQQPRLEVLFEIAKILGVKPQELLKEEK